MKRQNVIFPAADRALRTLGENLRLARRRRKITAQMMAERANLSLMTLRAIERGRRREGRDQAESDYILGVCDLTRQGGIRLKTDSDGAFEAPETEVAAPPWTMLRRLEDSARHLDADYYRLTPLQAKERYAVLREIVEKGKRTK